MAATLVGACATMGSVGSPAAEPPGIGQPFPDIAVKALSGDRDVRIGDLRGKVVLVDIWASWCGPCKEELPMLDDMAARLAARGVQIVAISIDEDKQSAQTFLRARPRWSLSLAHDPGGKVPNLLQLAQMPTSYIIDRTGILRHVQVGFDRADAATIEARLTELASAH